MERTVWKSNYYTRGIQ